MIDFKPSDIKLWSRLGSCGAFGAACNELAETDDNFAVVTADLCFYSGLERFRQKHTDKLYNVGIAEQNMIGMAAGMASEGMNVFASTYAAFASTRCLDQVRINMGYMKLPIKLVGLTSGLSVGILGATHMGNEDIAIMRSIPNITVISPADTTETVKALLAASRINSPVYLRLSGTMGSPIVYKSNYDYKIGKAITLRNGRDIAVIATGTMVATALQVADIISEHGLSTKVIDMHTIKPLDLEAIKQCCDCNMIITIEEHSIIGGLGAAVSEVLSTMNNKPRQYIIGISDEYKHAAQYDFLLNQYGLAPQTIANKILVYSEEI